MYDKNVCPGTQMVKVHSQNEVLRLIVALRVDKSTDLTTRSYHNFSLIIAIQLKTVALVQSESPDHGH